MLPMLQHECAINCLHRSFKRDEASEETILVHEEIFDDKPLKRERANSCGKTGNAVSPKGDRRGETDT